MHTFCIIRNCQKSNNIVFYYLLISRTKLLNEDILKLQTTSKEVSVGNSS